MVNPCSKFVTFFIRYQSRPSSDLTQVLLDKASDEDNLAQIQRRVIEGVSRGLNSLGHNMAEVFFSEMELSFNLRKGEILSRPEEFADAIYSFFKNGSSIVERTIGREMVKIFDIPVCPGLTFHSALEIVKRHPRTAKIFRGNYDPVFCKTCQKLGTAYPSMARVPFSDCEHHFSKRVVRLQKSVLIIGRLRVKGILGA